MTTSSFSSISNFLSFNLSPKPPLSPPQLLPLPHLSLSQKCKHTSPPKAIHDDGHGHELGAVINPSFAYANTLYYKSSAYNVQVIVDENEPEERLLNRFRREVMRAGVIQECKRRRFFENKQDEKKRKTREAAKRNRRRRPQFRSSNANKQADSTSKKGSIDDGDNWDMPEGAALP